MILYHSEPTQGKPPSFHSVNCQAMAMPFPGVAPIHSAENVWIEYIPTKSIFEIIQLFFQIFSPILKLIKKVFSTSLNLISEKATTFLQMDH